MTERDAAAPDGFRAQIEPLRASLANLISVRGQIPATFGYLPDAGSPAMAELAAEKQFAGAWGKEPVAGTYTIINLMMALADDNIGCVTRLYEDDQAPVFGQVVLARSTLEACGRARWLAAPNVSPKIRVARGQTERIYSATELAQTAEFSVDAQALRKRILDTAEDLGFRKRSKKNTPPSLEERRPSTTKAITDLFADVGPGDLGKLLMSYYSGVAHATLYGLVQSVEAVAPDDAKVDVPNLGRIFASSQAALTVLAVLIEGYVRAVAVINDLFGYEDATWSSAVTDARNEVSKVLRERVEFGRPRLRDLLL